MTLHIGKLEIDEQSASDMLDELLTSYLDGELPPDDQKILELRLVKELGLRQRLAELRQAYDLLDDLPETPHDQRFTQSTIEHVVQIVKQERPDSAEKLRRKRMLLGWMWRFPTLLVASVLIGTLLGLIARGFAIKNELNNLTLIANLSGLRSANDIEVIKQLSKDTVALDLLKQRFSKRFVPNVPADHFARPDWVKHLTPTQKSEIYRNREDLGRLKESEVDQARAFNSLLLQDSQSEELQDTVRLVGLVTDSLMPNDRLALVGMPPEERVVYLREQIYFSAADYYFTSSITSQDSQAIKDWFEDARYVMMSHIGGMRGGFGPPGGRERTPEERDESLINLYSALLFSPFANRDDDRLTAMLEPLYSELSEVGYQLFQGLTPTEQIIMLFNHLAPNRMGSDGHFIENYTKLPPQFRESLDLTAPSDSRMMMFEPRPGR